MADRHWLIKNCNLFDQLSSEHFSRLEASARVRRFPKGAPVYLPADAGGYVFLLAEGRVKLTSITPDGKQAILAFVDPGELFGELSLIGQSSREERAEAMQPSTVVLLSVEAFDEVMSRSPNLALSVTKLIGLRRRRVERRLRSLLFRSNRDRLIHLLLELAETYGREAPEGLHLAIPLSHQDIASVIGTTRETVTHLLGELQLHGMLKVARQKLVIKDLERLASEAHAEAPVADQGAGAERAPAERTVSPLSQPR